MKRRPRRNRTELLPGSEKKRSGAVSGSPLSRAENGGPSPKRTEAFSAIRCCKQAITLIDPGQGCRSHNECNGDVTPTE